MSLGGHVALVKASALYLGSAVPLETAMGLEAFQMPCRERYWSALDSSMKVDGIDASIIMYSSGLLMQYTADQRNVTWFPIQSLHACAALTTVSDAVDGRPRFVALDSPEGASSHHAPMFCAIMRRTRGIKVLECHVFICKSNETAMTMVQAMTHAFEHREGWLSDDALPPSVGVEALLNGGGGTRIIPASQTSSNGLAQKFSINTSSQQPPAQPPPAPVQPPPAPAPVNPPQQAAPVIQVLPVPLQNQYFANWDGFGGQAVMFIPGSPMNPEPKEKHKKHKKKKKQQKDDDEEEEEIYVLKKPGRRQEYSEYYQGQPEQQPRRYQQPPDDTVIYAPSQRVVDYIPQPDYGVDFNYYGSDPQVQYVDGQQIPVTDEYLLAQQQYEDDLAAARYEADVRAAQEYDDYLQYRNAQAAAAAGGYVAGDVGLDGVPVIPAAYDPALDAGYLHPRANVGPVPMVNRYGELVDGLGYYP